MAKKRSTGSDQGGLFPVSVSTMPEGYYSGDQPNPNLRAFVEAHVHERPYNPETDDYDVPAFNKPIETTKATAIYNMHTYWSKKPHDAIREYIQHYTQPGDLVLDPMCGSGGTALAALMEGRKAIAIDRSPAATFITKNYCTPVDTEQLQAAFEELERKVKPEIDWLYETRCDRCDGKATTVYTVYSQVFQCPRCLEKVPLFDCVEAERKTAKGKPKKIKMCPHCHARGIIEEVSTRSMKFGAVPVLVNYLCGGNCKPKRCERRHNDSAPQKQKYFEKYDLGKIKEIESKTIPYWYPKDRMMNATLDQKKWGLLWRPYHIGIDRVCDFYSKRNLWAMSLIYSQIDEFYKNISPFLFNFTSIALKTSLMMAHNNDGIGRIQKGVLYIPAIIHDVNVGRFWEESKRDLINGYKDIRILSKYLHISCQDARQLYIPDNSIDYIFSDPPYSWKVQFGELNFIWESWLRLDKYWHNDEIIINEFSGKNETEWANSMRQLLAQCYRVLKPNRWLSLCYHDTSEGTWALLQDILSEVGFISDKSDSSLFIDAKQKSIKQITADKVTQRDLLINFRKPKPGETTSQFHITGNEDETTFNDKVRMIIRDYLTSHPGSTKDRIYDEVVSRMIRAGRMEAHNFEELLIQVADEIREPVRKNLFEPADPDLFGTHEIRRWYLKETESGAEESERALEETTANRIEALLIQETTAAWRKSQPEWDSLKDREAEITQTLEAIQEDKPARRRLVRDLRDIEHRLQQLDAQRAEWQQHALHYTQIYEGYLPLSPKPKITLFELLADYFFQTAEGNWRPPADDSERQGKATLRTQAARRRLQRFCRLVEAGDAIPQDIQPGSATLAEWIRHCKRAGLYAQGKLLYEKGGLNLDDLSEEDMVNVEEDYQVCVRELTRSGGEQGKSRNTPRRR